MKLRSIFTNSGGILLSRIFGFIRDLMMASILGANLYSDIFFVAFKLPNLFRRIFGEGAFAQSFLPSFIASRYKSIFAARILLTFLGIIVLLSILVGIFSEPVTRIIAPGFSPEATLQAARYVAIQFWYLPLIFLVTFLGALLQWKEHFATTAFATVLLNIAIIGGLLLSRGMPKEQILLVLSYSVLVGGALQVLAHLIMARRFRLLRMLAIGFASLGTHSRKVAEDTRRFYTNFFPAIWGNSTAQVMAFLDTWLASFLASGSISYLYYANRIFQLPLALFAIALSTALFPSVAKLIRHKDEAGALREMKRGFWILLFLLSLATVGGVIFSTEIIWLLFERGAFGRADTIQTAHVLQMYLIGLLPFGLGKLFSLWLYSRHEQMAAAKIATWSLAGYALAAFALFQPLGAMGLALASTLSGFVSFTLLVRAFGREKFRSFLDKKRLILWLLTLALAAALMWGLHLLALKYLGV
ncbi:murein biosynthesis integral membrane protein MurJ [Nitratifractor salsuginis]|uniref:Probable lipid II flippase MurJ n=1 Tax=Nitratifractor salsuginis (strain DSM 16511 / JCM 12458 / E9I37-1) TaxID=749222 RepID=E6X2R5_NITSE|nr:murein biosynthesis integral membrane protein MurJ [Nitratifractor salsuginis]ADV46131.1 integral membrane protein MviN [Nitratifractor salsuginis DSM 16511]